MQMSALDGESKYGCNNHPLNLDAMGIVSQGRSGRAVPHHANHPHTGSRVISIMGMDARPCGEGIKACHHRKVGGMKTYMWKY